MFLVYIFKMLTTTVADTRDFDWGFYQAVSHSIYTCSPIPEKTFLQEIKFVCDSDTTGLRGTTECGKGQIITQKAKLTNYSGRVDRITFVYLGMGSVLLIKMQIPFHL